MAKLTTVVPDVWRIRLERLIFHLEVGNYERFVIQAAKYRAVPKEQCTYFSSEMLEELYDKLFEAELYVGVNVIDYTRRMLEELMTKLFKGYRYKVEFMHALAQDNANNILVGNLADLPALARQEISAHLMNLL